MSTQPSNEDDPQVTAREGEPGERTGLAPGTTLAGRYRVEKLIGEGGMGDVYLATHLKIDKQVAIKVLAPEQTRRPRTVSRFLQEAKASSRIRHDNVVDITDFGEDEGRAFFVMEYLEGEDLRFLLKREGRLPWARARGIAIQLLEGLGAAHDAEIVHRDIKPHNCFICAREHNAEFVKVIDFGIAKVRDGSEEQLTRTGAIMGTADYMSPEQGQGAELDGRSDLYSVGVILYRMLTGDVPFKAGNAMAILYQHVHTQATPPSEACPEAELGPEIDALVARALAKNPDDRFANARDFVAAIKAVGDGSAAALPVVAKSETTPRWPLVAAVGFVALAIAGVWIATREPDAEQRAGASTRAASVTSPVEGGSAARVQRAAAASNAQPPVVAAEALPASTGAVEKDAAAPGSSSGGEGDPRDEGGSEPDASDDTTLVPQRRSDRRVQQVLDRTASKVTACGKKSGLFPGEKVGVTVVIAPNGRPTSVTVNGTHAAAGESCIVSALKRARFGDAQRPQTVDHRFTI